jgi:hypothetical protein
MKSLAVALSKISGDFVKKGWFFVLFYEIGRRWARFEVCSIGGKCWGLQVAAIQKLQVMVHFYVQ